MAEYQKIEYRIGKDGKVTETVIDDGNGETCTLATQDIESIRTLASGMGGLLRQ